MGNMYLHRRRSDASQRKEAPAPVKGAARSDAALPGALTSGRRVDLPERMREKMENAFGADLSAVKLYESESVGKAGAKAITQGTNISFAPGLLDFSSYGGQALLGHELSHVISQARGEARASGLPENASLEARADREGAMAAAGQQVYGGPVTRARSGAAPSALSAGTMQARRDVDRAERIGSSMLLDRDLQKLYENSEKNRISSFRRRMNAGLKTRWSLETRASSKRSESGGKLPRTGWPSTGKRWDKVRTTRCWIMRPPSVFPRRKRGFMT